MKKFNKIYIGMFSILLLATSCNLVQDLDEYKPLYALDAETAITNESTADLALVGIYSAFRQGSSGGGCPYIFMVPDHLSGYAQMYYYYASRPEESGWITNNPLATGASRTGNMYTGMYDLINRANWLISALDQLDDSAFETPGRRESMLAEAKILRAMGNFYLLRMFGEFYDVDSEYGITLRTSPVKDGTALPRNTVAEVYTAIIADLDEGIANAPDLIKKNYTNKTFAKALKSRVLLYKGDYSAAASLAKDVIDNSGSNFMLEDNIADIFGDHLSAATFDSKEVLFGSSGEPGAGLGIGNFNSGFFSSINQKYMDEIAGSMLVGGQTIDYGGSRLDPIIFQNLSYGGYYSTKYTSYFTSGDYEMVYHMRMTEVYLILAEASARAASSVTTEALDALNTIRTRSGATTTGEDGFETYPSTITYDQFLEAVRIDKLIELQAEIGESWFDLIRYDYADGFGSGFQVSDIKPTATNPQKFILPIPQESIDVGGNVVAQNPSYE